MKVFLAFFCILLCSPLFGQTKELKPADTTYYENELKVEIRKINSKKYLKTTYGTNGQKMCDETFKNILLYRKPLSIDKGFARGRDRKWLDRKHFYKEVVENGKCTLWYPNGKVEGICFYKRGHLRKFSKWDEDGKLLVKNKRVNRREHIGIKPIGKSAINRL